MREKAACRKIPSPGDSRLHQEGVPTVDTGWAGCRDYDIRLDPLREAFLVVLASFATLAPLREAESALGKFGDEGGVERGGFHQVIQLNLLVRCMREVLVAGSEADRGNSKHAG